MTTLSPRQHAEKIAQVIRANTDRWTGFKWVSIQNQAELSDGQIALLKKALKPEMNLEVLATTIQTSLWYVAM